MKENVCQVRDEYREEYDGGRGTLPFVAAPFWFAC
jgi:hypothetical protein